MRQKTYISDILSIAESLMRKFGEDAKTNTQRRARKASDDNEAWVRWTDVATAIDILKSDGLLRLH